MVLCDDRDLHERMLFLRDHGRLPGDVSFRSVEVGWKYKMSELQAALGRVQLDRIDELIARKRQIFGWYEERLDGLPVAAQRRAPRRAGDVLDGHRDLRRGDGRDAATVRDALAADGIATRPFFPPLSSLPAFAVLAGYRSGGPREPGQLRPRGARHQPSVGADALAKPTSTGSAVSIRSLVARLNTLCTVSRWGSESGLSRAVPSPVRA